MATVEKFGKVTLALALGLAAVGLLILSTSESTSEESLWATEAAEPHIHPTLRLTEWPPLAKKNPFPKTEINQVIAR